MVKPPVETWAREEKAAIEILEESENGYLPSGVFMARMSTKLRRSVPYWTFRHCMMRLKRQGKVIFVYKGRQIRFFSLPGKEKVAAVLPAERLVPRIVDGGPALRASIGVSFKDAVACVASSMSKSVKSDVEHMLFKRDKAQLKMVVFKSGHANIVRPLSHRQDEKLRNAIVEIVKDRGQIMQSDIKVRGHSPNLETREGRLLLTVLLDLELDGIIGVELKDDGKQVVREYSLRE